MSVYKALTIAGSDSGGGAGIQADLKTFQELGVYGMSVITAVTAQNTLGVQGVYPMSAEAIEQQLASIGKDLPPDALKTGMLFSGEIIRIVAAAIQTYKWERVVVDPVMIAKGGASLLQQEAIDAMIHFLLPLADVVTPNIPEAEALSGLQIADSESRQEAAKRIHLYGCKNVMIKGGHDVNTEHATDLLYDGKTFTEFSSRRLVTKHTHGTGCTFAAAVTSGLAQGLTTKEAIELAKRFIQAAIAEPLHIGSGHGPTNHWAYQRGVRASHARTVANELDRTSAGGQLKRDRAVDAEANAAGLDDIFVNEDVFIRGAR